jgi:hypothetical protein
MAEPPRRPKRRARWRGLLLAGCAAATLGGCASTPSFLPHATGPDPAAAARQPQSHNRMRISENTDIFGI